MGQLYEDNHEEDYFLYVAYSDESVYGKWIYALLALQMDWTERVVKGICVRQKQEMGERTGQQTTYFMSSFLAPLLLDNYYFIQSWVKNEGFKAVLGALSYSLNFHHHNWHVHKFPMWEQVEDRSGQEIT